jgi:hypothetical protein
MENQAPPDLVSLMKAISEPFRRPGWPCAVKGDARAPYQQLAEGRPTPGPPRVALTPQTIGRRPRDALVAVVGRRRSGVRDQSPHGAVRNRRRIEAQRAARPLTWGGAIEPGECDFTSVRRLHRPERTNDLIAVEQATAPPNNIPTTMRLRTMTANNESRRKADAVYLAAAAAFAARLANPFALASRRSVASLARPGAT